MSELAGKPKNSDKNCEIIYVEEKAPEPWIQRESFYNKDLPLPEDDEDRLSDAKHIGSFMVPSPLMRLKTPSSMSSFNSDRSEDGKISPVPSLDRSLKSERGDSESSLARGQDGQVEGLPQLYGLFDGSKVSVQDDLDLSENDQDMVVHSVDFSDEELIEDIPVEEQDYLSSEMVGSVERKLGLASIMEVEVVPAKSGIQNEGLRDLTKQAPDSSKDIHSKSTVQTLETESSNNTTLKDGKGDLSASNIQSDLVSANENAILTPSMAARDIVEGSLNAGTIESCVGVTGASTIVPLAALGAAGVLASQLSSREKISSSSEIDQLGNDQQNVDTLKEYNSANGSGNSDVDEAKLTPELGSVNNTKPKDYNVMEDNLFNEIGDSTLREGAISTEGHSLDSHIGAPAEHYGKGVMGIGVIETGIAPVTAGILSSQLGAPSLGVSEDQGTKDIVSNDQVGVEMDSRVIDESEIDMQPSQITQDMVSVSEGRFEISDSSSQNLKDKEHLNNALSAIQAGPNMSELQSHNAEAMEELSSEHVDNMKDLSSKHADTMKESTIHGPVSEVDSITGRGYGNELGDLRAEAIDGELLTDMKPSIGLGLAAGVASSAVGTSAEIFVGSTLVTSPNSEIPGSTKSSNGIDEYGSVSSENEIHTLQENEDIGPYNAEQSGQNNSHDVNNLTENSPLQSEIADSSIIENNENTFAQTKGDRETVQIQANLDEIKEDHLGLMQQESEVVGSGSEISKDQLFSQDLSNGVDQNRSENLENEGFNQDNAPLSSQLERDFNEPHVGNLESEFVFENLGISSGPDGNEVTENSEMLHDYEDSNIDVTVESGLILQPFNDNELDSLLLSYDKLLKSEMTEVAEHLAANNIMPEDYAKAWFESIFAGSEFSPAFSAEASNIYVDHGPEGLVEVALDLMKLNAQELLALDSRDQILAKLSSDMNPDGVVSLNGPSSETSQEINVQELGMNGECLCDSKLRLLVAKCRNAEELLKQLSEIIKEMNDDINELTCENNKKSLRIKLLEDALQEKEKK